MDKVTPCLWFVSAAQEAVELYVSLVPGSRITRIQHSLTDTPAGPAGSVLVIEFILGGRPFMALNGGVPMPGSGVVSLSVDCADQAEVDGLWDALSAGGTIHACGWLADRWGITWQIVPSVLPRYLGDPDRARATRVMQAMMGMVKLDVAALTRAWEGTAGDDGKSG